MKIFVVCKVGPEWLIPVEAWKNRKDAQVRCVELDKDLDKGDVFDNLSKHRICQIMLKD